MRRTSISFALAVALAGCSSSSTPPNATGDMAGSTTNTLKTEVVLNAANGINFDDWYYSASLHKLVVPGAGTGDLYLVDPQSLQVSTISGFDATAPTRPMSDGGRRGPPDGFVFPDGGFGGIPDGGFRMDIPFGGSTSATEANKIIYAIDRSDVQLYVVDPVGLSIISKVALGGNPDYVRYVAASNELWVTQPDSQQIEVFGFAADGKTPQHKAYISVPNGPEGLYVDNTHSLVYTNANASTLVINPAGGSSSSITKTWTPSGGCMRPGGITMDEKNSILLVACGENGMVSIDASTSATAGTVISQVRNASGPSSVGFSPTLRHVYMPGPSTDIIAVSDTGTLTNQGGVPTPYGERQAVADEYGNFWVQEQVNAQSSGAVLRIQDPFAATP